MTTVSSTTASTLTSTSDTATSQSVDAATITADFEFFLKMLTTQMQNQDPMNPLDSSDYAVQLATFSSVEQQVQTNDLLAEILAQQTSSDMSQMASWIGTTVRATTTATYAGEPVEIYAEPSSSASSAQLVVLNSSGTEVGRFDIPTDANRLEWDGTSTTGATLAWGTYSFQIESLDSEGSVISTTDAQIYDTVEEVQIDGDSLALILSGGSSISVEDVTSVSSSSS